MSITRRRYAPPRIHVPPARQQGFALIALMTIVSVVLAYVLISGLNVTRPQAERERKTAEALARAKEALIAYAATYGHLHPGQSHGYLPCPNTAAPEGSATPPCGTQNVSVIGRLPWKELGIPPLFDGDGECLWYAVSGRYKNNPKTDVLLNWDTIGQFVVFDSNGTSTLAGPAVASPTSASEEDQNDSLAVAVIFAPGPPLTGQSRSSTPGTTCSGAYSASTASAYLDNDTLHSINNAAVSSTANAVSQFVSGVVRDGSGNPLVNDRMVIISKHEIFDAMAPSLRAMTKKAAECVAWFATQNANYTSDGDSRLPWAAPLTLSNYTLNCEYNDRLGFLAGRLPNKVNTAAGATGISSMASSACDEAGTTPNQLLRQSSPCPGWTAHFPLWNQWKSFLFYAVSRDFAPNGDETSTDCGDCISVSGTEYAAVVQFANRRLTLTTSGTPPTLQRRTVNLGNALNYLEGINATHINLEDSATGQEAYVTGGAPFNDVMFCIAENLAVTQCP